MIEEISSKKASQFASLNPLVCCVCLQSNFAHLQETLLSKSKSSSKAFRPVQCSKCKRHWHGICLGLSFALNSSMVKWTPNNFKGSFECEECRLWGGPSIKKEKCMVCLAEDLVWKKKLDEKTNSWVHVPCAMVSDRFYINSYLNMSISMAELPEKGKKKVAPGFAVEVPSDCVICGQKGELLSCQHSPKCSLSCHFLCFLKFSSFHGAAGQNLKAIFSKSEAFKQFQTQISKLKFDSDSPNAFLVFQSCLHKNLDVKIFKDFFLSPKIFRNTTSSSPGTLANPQLSSTSSAKLSPVESPTSIAKEQLPKAKFSKSHFSEFVANSSLIRFRDIYSALVAELLESHLAPLIPQSTLAPGFSVLISNSLSSLFFSTHDFESGDFLGSQKQPMNFTGSSGYAIRGGTVKLGCNEARNRLCFCRKEFGQLNDENMTQCDICKTWIHSECDPNSMRFSKETTVSDDETFSCLRCIAWVLETNEYMNGLEATFGGEVKGTLSLERELRAVRARRNTEISGVIDLLTNGVIIEVGLMNYCKMFIQNEISVNSKESDAFAKKMAAEKENLAALLCVAKAIPSNVVIQINHFVGQWASKELEEMFSRKIGIFELQVSSIIDWEEERSLVPIIIREGVAENEKRQKQIEAFLSKLHLPPELRRQSEDTLDLLRVWNKIKEWVEGQVDYCLSGESIIDYFKGGILGDNDEKSEKILRMFTMEEASGWKEKIEQYEFRYASCLSGLTELRMIESFLKKAQSWEVKARKDFGLTHLSPMKNPKKSQMLSDETERLLTDVFERFKSMAQNKPNIDELNKTIIEGLKLGFFPKFLVHLIKGHQKATKWLSDYNQVIVDQSRTPNKSSSQINERLEKLFYSSSELIVRSPELIELIEMQRSEKMWNFKFKKLVSEVSLKLMPEVVMDPEKHPLLAKRTSKDMEEKSCLTSKQKEDDDMKREANLKGALRLAEMLTECQNLKVWDTYSTKKLKKIQVLEKLKKKLKRKVTKKMRNPKHIEELKLKKEAQELLSSFSPSILPPQFQGLSTKGPEQKTEKNDKVKKPFETFMNFFFRSGQIETKSPKVLFLREKIVEIQHLHSHLRFFLSLVSTQEVSLDDVNQLKTVYSQLCNYLEVNGSLKDGLVFLLIIKLVNTLSSILVMLPSRLVFNISQLQGCLPPANPSVDHFIVDIIGNYLAILNRLAFENCTPEHQSEFLEIETQLGIIKENGFDRVPFRYTGFLNKIRTLVWEVKFARSFCVGSDGRLIIPVAADTMKEMGEEMQVVQNSSGTQNLKQKILFFFEKFTQWQRIQSEFFNFWNPFNYKDLCPKSPVDIKEKMNRIIKMKMWIKEEMLLLPEIEQYLSMYAKWFEWAAKVAQKLLSQNEDQSNKRETSNRPLEEIGPKEERMKDLLNLEKERKELGVPREWVFAQNIQNAMAEIERESQERKSRGQKLKSFLEELINTPLNKINFLILHQDIEKIKNGKFDQFQSGHSESKTQDTIESKQESSVDFPTFEELPTQGAQRQKEPGILPENQEFLGSLEKIQENLELEIKDLYNEERKRHKRKEKGTGLLEACFKIVNDKGEISFGKMESKKLRECEEMIALKNSMSQVEVLCRTRVSIIQKLLDLESDKLIEGDPEKIKEEALVFLQNLKNSVVPLQSIPKCTSLFLQKIDAFLEILNSAIALRTSPKISLGAKAFCMKISLAEAEEQARYLLDQNLGPLSEIWQSAFKIQKQKEIIEDFFWAIENSLQKTKGINAKKLGEGLHKMAEVFLRPNEERANKVKKTMNLNKKIKNFELAVRSSFSSKTAWGSSFFGFIFLTKWLSTENNSFKMHLPSSENPEFTLEIPFNPLENIPKASDGFFDPEFLWNSLSFIADAKKEFFGSRNWLKNEKFSSFKEFCDALASCFKEIKAEKRNEGSLRLLKGFLLLSSLQHEIKSEAQWIFKKEEKTEKFLEKISKIFSFFSQKKGLWLFPEIFDFKIVLKGLEKIKNHFGKTMGKNDCILIEESADIDQGKNEPEKHLVTRSENPELVLVPTIPDNNESLILLFLDTFTMELDGIDLEKTSCLLSAFSDLLKSFECFLMVFSAYSCPKIEEEIPKFETQAEKMDCEEVDIQSSQPKAGFLVELIEEEDLSGY